MPGANVHRLLCVLTTGKPRRGAASDERARIEQPKYRVDGNRHNRILRETNSRAPNCQNRPARHTTRATHRSRPRGLGAMTASKATVARHTVTFEGVDAPSQRAPAPRFGDSTGARPSSSSLAEKQTVARDDHHVEGAFRGARVAPRLSADGTAPVARSTPAPSPRPKSRAEPRSPVTAARRRVVAAEVKLGVERMKLLDKFGNLETVVTRTDDSTRERAGTPLALARPIVSNVTFARATTRPGTSAAASRGCFATTSRRRGGRSSSSTTEPGLATRGSTRVGPHIARPHAGACTSLAAARQPSRTGLLPAQGRCDDSAAAALREMVARCNLTRGAGEGRGDVYAWNLSPPSPPRARPAAGDADEDDSSPEWNPGRVTPW